VSEKLAAYVALYGQKAKEGVDKAKERLKKSEEKLTAATEFWESTKREANKLGIEDKFLSVFPKPGGDLIATDGVSVNPNYSALFQYGDTMTELVKELSKMKNSANRVETNKKSLADSESFAARKPEDHLNLLENAILKLASSSYLAIGLQKETLFKKIFESYESYSDDFIVELKGAEGPIGVNSSMQAYELLKEKFEAGTAFSNKEEETKSESPINEPVKEKPEAAAQTDQANINPPQKVEKPAGEKTTVEESTVVEKKPELVKSEQPAVAGTSINLNLEKNEQEAKPKIEPAPVLTQPLEPTQATTEPTASSINLSKEEETPKPVPAPSPIVEQTSTTLSENKNVSSSNINSQSISGPTSTSQTLGGPASTSQTSISTESNVVNNTINTISSIDSEKKKPGLFKKVLSAAGKALSPFIGNLGEKSKDALEVAKYKLNQILPINTISKAFSKKEKEKEFTGASQLNLTSSPTKIENTKTETSFGGPTNNSVSTTTASPTVETTVEKTRPAVEETQIPAKVETPPAQQQALPAQTQAVTPQSPTLTESGPTASPTEGATPKSEQPPQSSSSTDLSSIEKRLKKIELALTGPLEVIIKER